MKESQSRAQEYWVTEPELVAISADVILEDKSSSLMLGNRGRTSSNQAVFSEQSPELRRWFRVPGGCWIQRYAGAVAK